MRILFNIEESIKINPPEQLYYSYPYIKFKKRISINLKDIVRITDQGVSLQSREKDLELEETNNLADSFRDYGVMYDKNPMVVHKTARGEYELDAGFNRCDTLLNELNVDTYFADLVEYDSEYYRQVFKRSSNLSPDHIGKGTPTKKGDYQKGLIEMKNGNSFNWRDDDAVLKALDDMSCGKMKDSVKETALKNFRKIKGNIAVGVLPLNAPMANKKIKELGLPYSGYVDKENNPAYGRIGYVKGFGDFESKVVTWIKESLKHDTIVEIYGFIEYINPDLVLKQRALWLRAFDKVIAWIEIFMPMHKDRIQFKGFIAQITSADPNNQGRPMETGIVDQFGTSIEL